MLWTVIRFVDDGEMYRATTERVENSVVSVVLGTVYVPNWPKQNNCLMFAVVPVNGSYGDFRFFECAMRLYLKTVWVIES